MTIYKFIDTLNTRRAPFHYDPAIENAWGKLWGFRIKHPDSTRTIRARQRAIEFRQARAAREVEL